MRRILSLCLYSVALATLFFSPHGLTMNSLLFCMGFIMAGYVMWPAKPEEPREYLGKVMYHD